MSLFVLCLVMTSASIHVFWNALVKKCENKASFAWLTHLVSVGVFLLPAFLLSRILHPGVINIQIMCLAAISGGFEALYIITLYTAYGKGDLSIVYPLSRGVAPVFTLMAGSVIVGDSVSFTGGISVAVILAGLMSMSLSTRHASAEKHDWYSIILALLTGLMIAGYHLVDRRTMKLTDRPATLEYLFLMMSCLLFYLSIWMVSSQKRRKVIWREWVVNKKGVMIVGLCTPLAYFLIILALRYGNVTYITAGRNIGIVISVIVGAVLFHEPVGKRRIIGALIIALGVIGLVVFNP